ncbi:MAG: hypothetical protein HZB62_10735 [Nitrospirae bacterium]|nr:hypothetical protein [Nitrospirota bacterium]
MPTVNSAIKRILREKEAGISSGIDAILALLREMQAQVIGDLGKAALGSWDSYQLKKMLNSLESQISSFDSQAKAEMNGLLNTSVNNGVMMVDGPLAMSGISMGGFGLGTSVLDTLKDFAFHKLEGLSSDLWQKLKGELTLGILGGKTPQEVAAAIGKTLGEDRGIFTSVAARAEAITKTEMGRVFSQATQLRMDQAGAQVEGFGKQWKHAGNPKEARPSHEAVHNQHVAYDKPFIVGGSAMMFPRDPAAPIAEVINCG